MSEDRTPVAVTGASGFIGRAAVQALCDAGLPVRAISRARPADGLRDGVAWPVVPDYRSVGALGQAIEGARCVIHLADNPARGSSGAVAEAAAIAGCLVAAMAEAGPSRLILASSVYARLDDAPDGYGAAKRAVETEVLGATTLQPVVLRLPPVYGPGCRGGFGTLAGLVRRGLPLPLAGAQAPRAYLSRRNLCDLLVAMACAGDAEWQAAAGTCFEPSDGEQIGTADLVRLMAQACGRPARQIPLPIWSLRALGAVSGRSATVSGAVDRLDVAGNEPLTRAFGWTPAERMPASLAFLGQTA